MLSVLLLAAATGGCQTDHDGPRAIGGRSGLAWASGAFVAGGQPAPYEAFGAWRDRPLDVAVIWTDRQDWDDLTDPWLLDSAWDVPDVTMSIGMPPFPEGIDGSLAACAAGDYDARWTAAGRRFADAGWDDRTIIRLGWEFNGDWYEWSMGDEPEVFAACWRRVHEAAEAEAPALRWEWTASAGFSRPVADAAPAWPGDDYVDIVGVDKYDDWPHSCTDADWRRHHLGGPSGLDAWLAFATQHGKPLAVPEWAAAMSGSPCPDNAGYVTNMTDFFRANAEVLAYEAYFNHSAGDHLGSIHDPEDRPATAARYLDAYAG